jgi:hypothetical protein
MIERPQPNPAGLLLATQDRRDEVAGQDEEHVHAQVPLARERRPDVVGDDHEHRDGAQAIQGRVVFHGRTRTRKIKPATTRPAALRV